MEDSSSIDLSQLANQLKLELASLQKTVELLELGNTVPFITRFRKDQTGGLDEQQIRAIQRELARSKHLHERKESILKSIESRQQLTPQLRDKIHAAKTMRVLEELYLPYKPKKKSLAYVARSRGLMPLAEEVLNSTADAAPLGELAAKYVDPEKDLANDEAVLSGVRHLLAEHFCNRAELRSMLRRHLWHHGLLVSKKVDERPDGEAEPATDPDEADGEAQHTGQEHPAHEEAPAENAATESPADPTAAAEQTVTTEQPTATAEQSAEVTAPSTEATTPAEVTVAAPDASVATPTDSDNDPPDPESSSTPNEPPPTATVDSEPTALEQEATAPSASPDADVAAPPQPNQPATKPAEEAPAHAAGVDSTPTSVTPKKEDAKNKKKALAREQRRATRRRRRERLVQSFKDYFDFQEPVGKLPHHRILAINRGERTKVLRVKVECPEWEKLEKELRQKAIGEDHPHAAFLIECLHDSLNRLMFPSIEREVRRELNDKAEEHAVKVFAKNLRKLLLQPPLRQQRVIAIDPGFRNGCKVVALDEFGNILGHSFINLLGKDQQKEQGRQELAKFVREHKGSVIAIGNGAASRETETMVGELLSNELSGEDVGYLIVNEAGTSVYSTSELGREELPNVDPTVRSAVSIGRRALDPLSELVKVDPASIGVGLYQHDVKAKHLKESLDDVVESCVNYVGVDVNSASPSLLRYVSGLNRMTANQIYKHREKNGPFKSREQLREVSGIGESSYVQAVGFLRISDGENPLDGTWIHPESYGVAQRILAAIQCDAEDLRPRVRTTIDAARRSGDEKPPSAGLSASEEKPPVAEATSPDAAGDPSSSSTPAKDVATAPAETESDSAPQTEDAKPADDTADGPTTPPTTDGATAEAAADSVSEESTVQQPTSEAGVDVTSPTSEPQSADQQAVAAPTDAPADATPAKETGKPAPAVASKEFVSGLSTEVVGKLNAVDVGKLAPQLGVGKLMLKDILSALARPGRDPREDVPRPPFRKGILKLEDLRPGMELSGTVLNVVDFGAFVDIGLVDSGLIHVSRLADKYIADPHDVVSVGDILRVWVVEVDSNRRRVSLTAIEPGTERPKREREPRKPRGASPKRPAGKGKPQTGGRSRKRRDDRREGKRGGQASKEYRAKTPPKPVVPITKEMEDGKEPMRTFGDLKQLFDKKRKGGK